MAATAFPTCPATGIKIGALPCTYTGLTPMYLTFKTDSHVHLLAEANLRPIVDLQTVAAIGAAKWALHLSMFCSCYSPEHRVSHWMQ